MSRVFAIESWHPRNCFRRRYIRNTEYEGERGTEKADVDERHMDHKGKIGEPVTRLEDLPLVRGRGCYIGDIDVPHQLHMRVVRSPYAHGRIRGIDAAAARALPGVFAVWTGEDTADLPPIDFRDPSAEGLKPYRQPVLARQRVRYVGEPVAIVFAEDRYIAEDAADLVSIEVEPLPVLMNAIDPPGEFGGHRTTEATVLQHSYGDVEAAFARAHAVVEIDLKIGRHSGVPLETRGAIGIYDAARDILELHGAAKVPHRNRDTLVRMLGRSPASIHLHEYHVGGGFGVRGELYPEDILVCIAALRFGRPVKWIEDRREHLMATNHSRQQHHLARVAVDAEGRILGLQDEIFLDQGAYIRTHGARVLARTLWSIPGPYRVPAYRAIGHFRLTNKTPAATYRAPGGFESTFVRERLLDGIADKLGLDRLEVRRRNLLQPADMPYTRPFDEPGIEPLIFDSGDYPGLLEKALNAFGWNGFQADVQRRRAAGELVGVGFSVFMDESGRGPTDGAKVSIDTSGEVELVTGGASLGQGFETVMAQICADSLGLDYQRVRVIHGQTDRIAHGIGAHASRATVLTGNAVHATAQKLRQKILEFSSELLQLPTAALEIENGAVRARDESSGPSITLAEIARRVAPGSKFLAGRVPGLSCEAWYNTDQLAISYGIHIALVRIDRETGKIDVERYLTAEEVGRAVNPMMIKGQLVGGCAQGLGGSLFEEFSYDPNGEPLSVTYADYLLPTVHDVPQVEVLLTEDAPSPFNPLGIKGAGEGGINGVGAAIAGAIDDAVGVFGIATQLPVTPVRLKQAIAGKSHSGRR
jgi:carbon-monoxide dehydrogenase large subunit/6-hydroxypseudooxynicotine dehydrogenase subunit gamma